MPTRRSFLHALGLAPLVAAVSSLLTGRRASAQLPASEQRPVPPPGFDGVDDFMPIEQPRYVYIVPPGSKAMRVDGDGLTVVDVPATDERALGFLIGLAAYDTRMPLGWPQPWCMPPTGEPLVVDGHAYWREGDYYLSRLSPDRDSREPDAWYTLDLRAMVGGSATFSKSMLEADGGLYFLAGDVLARLSLDQHPGDANSWHRYDLRAWGGEREQEIGARLREQQASR
jgi:hypothetical protein